jgi:hypothetical protein
LVVRENAELKRQGELRERAFDLANGRQERDRPRIASSRAP